MSLWNRKRVLAIGAAGLLAASAIGATVAHAQEPPEEGEEQSGRHHHPFGFLGIRAIVNASGLDFETFRAGFAEGQTINEVLEANGVDPAEVKATVLANLEAKLAELVANGRITQERADEILANAPEQLDRLMNATPPEPGDRPVRRIIFGAMESAAEAIGIDVEALMQALRDGQTPAEVAEANGVEPQQVIDDMVASLSERLDERVAEGELDAEKAAEIEERAPERIAEFVNEGPPRFGGDPRGEGAPEPSE